MKKKSIIYVFLIISVLLPIKINAKTISEFEAEVNKYTAELNEKKNKIVKNDQEIAAVRKNIANIESQIKSA